MAGFDYTPTAPLRRLCTRGALGLALLLAAPAALAQDANAEGQDGKSVAASAEKVRAKATDLDANGDGWLAEDETAKGRDKLGVLYGAIARRVDANGDGRVAVDEYVDAQIQALEAADADKDGWITRAEARAQQRRLVLELLGGG